MSALHARSSARVTTAGRERRRRWSRRLGLVVSLSLVAGLVTVVTEPVTGPAPAAAATTTFAYTGTPQLYVVPAGVTSLTVTVKGGGGGTPSGGAAGGAGGVVTANIAVQPGQVLQLNVGGQGSLQGGWNGGGANYGGGASDIRTDSGSSVLTSCAYALTCGLSDRLVVAGGGGGGGSFSGATGGVGGQTATAGTAANAGTGNATGGGAATAGAGGSAGTGTAGSTAAVTATAGASGSGGRGASSPDAYDGTTNVFARAGGGGGGYYGGGGGGVAATAGAAGGSSGGGGGTSYAGGAGVSGATFTDGTNAGNGEIVIDPANALPTVASNGATPPVSTSIVYGYTGAAQVYAVPNNVDLLHVTLFGGAGSGSAEGDVVSGLFPVSPGGFLQINVGGRGTGWVDDGTGAMDAAKSYKGGWNGGGNGAQANLANGGVAGGGGGGSTDIRMCGTAVVGGCNVTERRVIAAGGGGDSLNSTGSTGGGNANGSAASPSGASSGQGGSLTSGGTGGNLSGVYGESGGPGYGGRGLPAAPTQVEGAGGGGGGLYGGGGGNSGAGGGGSSCASVMGACTASTNEFTKTDPVFTHRQGGNLGAGFAVITPVSVARTAEDASSPAQPTAPSNVVADSAKIYGAVNPMNLAAEPRVYYATTDAAIEVPGTGSMVVLTQSGTSTQLLTGDSWLNVEGTITGLTASTQYYYRVCAASVAGTVCGPIKSFTTMVGPVQPTVGNPTVQTLTITNTAASFTGAVTNPGTGPTNVVFECATDSAFTTGLVTGTATPATVTGVTSININGSCTGLTSNQAYYVRIKATNTAMGSGNIGVSATPATFTTVGTPAVGNPTVTAGSESASYAAFTADVTNPGGGTSTSPTSLSFECSTDPTFATGVIAGPAAPSVALGTSPVNGVTGSCSNLTDFSTYYVRFKATNSAGTAYSASAASFNTLPIIAIPTISAAVATSNVTTTSVDLTGTVNNPGHGPTSIFFDCSTSSTFTVLTTVSFPATPSTASGISSTSVTGSCAGLSTNTQYYTRLRAVNTAGTATSPGVSGSPVTFTTVQAPYPPVVGTLALGSGTPLTETTAALTVDITDPGVGPTTVVFQCSTSPTFPNTAATQTVTASTSPVSGTSAVNNLTATCGSGTALTPMTQYYARVKATNSAAPAGMFSNVVPFTTLAYAITPTVGTVTVVNGSVTTTSAGFTGTVTNPGSGGSSSAWSNTTVGLQCATNASFTTGLVTGTLTTPVSGTVSGRTPSAVAGTCTGLTPNSVYYVRVSATATITDPSDPNYTAAQPYTVYSSNATFATPPTVTLPVVSNLAVASSPATTDNSASFTADVDPSYGVTSVVFECSTSSLFTTIAATVVASPSPVTGSGAVPVAATCAPLSPSTTYYVRVKATNSAGMTTYSTTPTATSATTLASITLPAVSNVSLTSVVSPAVNPDYTSALIEATVTSTGNGTADVELQCDTTPAFINPTVVTAYTDPAMTTPAASLTGLSAIQIYGECGSLTNNTSYFARARVWNSAGSDYSTSVFQFTTPATVITPTVAALSAATSAIDVSGSVPYTTTVASLVGSITNPGSGNVTGSWSDTAVGFECATNAAFTTGLVTGTVTIPVSGNVTGRSPVTVTGTCAGLTPNTLYYARATATNTPTGGSQTTVDGTAITFTTVNIVVPPVFSNATIPTPPAGTPTIPTVTAITTPGSTPNTTEVTGVVDAGTTVTIKVDGSVRMAGNPAAPTDLCTVTGTAYVCILDPDVAANQTLTVISTDPTATPNPLSSHIDVLVPTSGTTPGSMGPMQVTIGSPMVAERVTLATTVNPGVGPTTITYVYSTNPLFATASFASVPSNQLVECQVSPALTGSSAAAVPPRQCVGLPNTVTTYWVRAKAENSPTNGQSGLIPVWSNASMFTTTTRTWAPSAPLGIDVTGTTSSSIALSAIVDPGNASTTVTYECSVDPTFNPVNDPNLVTVVAAQSPVSGSSVVPTSATCTGLVDATQYYVRILLVNSAGTGNAASTATTTSPPAPSGGGGGGGGGGGAVAPPAIVLGSLAAVPPSPLLRPGAFTIFENGVQLPGTSTATANGAQISRADFAVTFRGLTPDRQAIPLGPEPDHEVIVACNGFVQVAGNGFKGGYMGQLYLFDGDTLLADVPMNEAGGFSVTVPMPQGEGGGDYNLQLNAYGMGLQVRSVTIGVKVDVCPPPPPVTIIGKKQVTTVQQVYFDEWSADLDAKAKDTLLKLVDQTSREPLKVKSIGFVQGKGTPQQGWELSQKRADNVLDFLTGKGRMNPKEAVARGENVDGNVNPNRMVQVTVVWYKRVQVQVPADQVPEGAEIVAPKGAASATEVPADARAASASGAVAKVTKADKARQSLAKAKADRRAAKRALADGRASKAEKQALEQAKREVAKAKRAVKQATKATSATKAAAKKTAKAKASTKAVKAAKKPGSKPGAKKSATDKKASKAAKGAKQASAKKPAKAKKAAAARSKS